MNDQRIREIVKQTTDFVAYVNSFYGPEGLYPMGATLSQIAEATQIVLERFGADGVPGHSFAFDSVDRERVRDVMIERFGLVFPQSQETGAVSVNRVTGQLRIVGPPGGGQVYAVKQLLDTLGIHCDLDDDGDTTTIRGNYRHSHFEIEITKRTPAQPREK